MAEQEAKVSLLFKSIADGFQQVDSTTDVVKADAKLREVTDQIKDVKGAVKEYETEARIDGIPNAEIRATKADMVSLVNKYVAQKKTTANRLAALREQQLPEMPLLAAPIPPPSGDVAGPSSMRQVQEMTNQEIIGKGRGQMDETDAALHRAARTIAETQETGAKTAAQLKAQTDQMGNIIDDLAEIDFTMKKASRVITDITRGLMTDKCIMCLLFLVVGAIIAAVILKVVGVDGGAINIPSPSSSRSDENQTQGLDIQVPNRKLLMSAVQMALRRAM